MEINLPKIEEEILKFWKENRIFEKSLEKTKNNPRFIFFEGPPFANGLPGIHHLLSRALKDVILRYKTMRGFYVERKAGWDTHGLPTEMSAEKNLGIKSKKEIEKDIKRFVEECEKNVFTYKKEWEEFTERMGYWLDLKNAYITCSNEYMESLWWILKKIWEKGFLYKDYKVVPYCPRCGTSLSSHEVAQGYKTVKDPSIYVKLKLKGEKNTYFLVWTTTPWTLPGNVAVAVNPDFSYVKIKIGKDYLILIKDKLSVIADNYEIIEEFKGKELKGKEYEPLFNFGKLEKKAYYVISGDFVSTEEGTGLVHIAPAFGEEDMAAGKENDLPIILNVDEEGKFKEEVRAWPGRFVKDADPLIVEDLRERGLLLKEELYEHEYPYCWRCDSPLLYYAKESWFIKTTAVKEDLIKNNEKINWIPDYLKEGRFGEWLKDVKDWNLSRERYWGTPLPIWRCGKCEKVLCIGSIEELEERIISPRPKNLHRPYIDDAILKCDCGESMRRVKEVIDCWFDSGAMPFAQWHYPFDPDSISSQGSDNFGARNKDLSFPAPKNFPADFICEGIDQTRGWFYTLLVISTLLGLGTPYKNVISNGIVLDAKGQKMSKSKGNIIKPSDVVEKYGADVARLYFYTINAVAEPKRFDFKDVQSLYRRFFDTLLNVQKFFDIYKDSNFKPKEKTSFNNILDKWIISLLENLNRKVVEKMENYNVVGAARLFDDFVENLSNWYIRRSRKRFQKAENGKEKEEASQALHYVLLKLSKLIAPFAPFFSESIYKKLGGEKESVHLEEYPQSEKDLIDDMVEKDMLAIIETAALALAKRSAAGVKVRQPLSLLKIKGEEKKEEYINLLKEEVNIEKIIFDKNLKEEIELNAEITPELREKGITREIIRHIQGMRKKAGFMPSDKISVQFFGGEELNNILEKNKELILKEGRINDLKLSKKTQGVFDIEAEIEIDQQKLWIKIKKK